MMYQSIGEKVDALDLFPLEDQFKNSEKVMIFKFFHTIMFFFNFFLLKKKVTLILHEII